MPTHKDTSNPAKPDQRLLALGEMAGALADQLRRGDIEGLDEVTRDQLTTEWLEVLEAMTTLPAQTRAGRRVKAGALLALASRGDTTHALFAKLALSLVADQLR
jgi:hypothetical protein